MCGMNTDGKNVTDGGRESGKVGKRERGKKGKRGHPKSGLTAGNGDLFK